MTFSIYLKHLNAQTEKVENDARISREILNLMDRLSHGQAESVTQARKTFEAQVNFYPWLEQEITRLVQQDAPTEFTSVVNETTRRVTELLPALTRDGLLLRMMPMENRTVALPSGKTVTGDYYAATLNVPDLRWIGEREIFVFIYVPEAGLIMSKVSTLPVFSMAGTVDEIVDYINLSLGGALSPRGG